MGSTNSTIGDQGNWIAIPVDEPTRQPSDRQTLINGNRLMANSTVSMSANTDMTHLMANQHRNRTQPQPHSQIPLPTKAYASSKHSTVSNIGTFNGSDASLTTTTTTSPVNHTNSPKHSFSQQHLDFRCTSGSLPVNTCSSVAATAGNEVRYVALHDYTKRVDDDLGMTKGQLFRILDQSHCDWWYAECIDTGQMGYVPRNHLAAVTSLESNEWYFGRLKRVEAEQFLEFPENEPGSFLVRLSESQSSEYALSVREEFTVKHYRIRSRSSRVNRDCRRYYISRQLPFATLEQLVNYYKENQSGLCCQLKRPCIRPVRPEPIGLSHKLVGKWEIPKSSIILKDKIGQGQFGEVYKAVWNKTTIVAVKTLKPSSCDAADFLREAQTMQRLRHPNLIQLYAVCTQSEPFFLITEFMSKSSLLSYLQTPEGGRLSMPCLVMMASKIASGMAYLESRQYIHRDLAARNVLVGEQKQVKIADFGLARMIHNREYVAHAGARFPVKWTAPEAANYSRFTIKSDVWSFGILLTEIVTHGRSPYPGMHNAEVLRQVESGYRMSQPPGCPPELYDLMLECWAADEQLRPSFDQIHARLEEFCEAEHPTYRNTIIGTLLPKYAVRTNPSNETATNLSKSSATVVNKNFPRNIGTPVFS